MRPLLPLLVALLGACATQDPAISSHIARFPSQPGELYKALEMSCTQPGHFFTRPARNIYECREYLDPEDTATAILLYDGTTGNLPQLVLRLTERPDGGDYLVHFETYLNVPQKSGAPVHVVYPGRVYDRQVASLFRIAGGVPE